MHATKFSFVYNSTDKFSWNNLYKFFFFIDVIKKEKVRMSSPSYVEEQQAIKESFKDALDNSDDDEDILKPRTKSKEEQVNLNLLINLKLWDGSINN